MPGADQRPAAVVTVGTFDGVHVGHAALVSAARGLAASSGARVTALVFDPHPAAVLDPGSEPARLLPFAAREALLRGAGADEVVRLDPSSGVLGLSPEGFWEEVCRERRVVGVVEGPDFRFGRGRAGDVETLRRIGGARGFEVRVVEQRRAGLSDGSSAPVSSTLVRWLLGEGRVRDAAACLGRLHEMSGVVMRGAQRGRVIGMPTANIEPAEMVPADGVYAAAAWLPGGAAAAAAVSVGTNPHFGGVRRTVEAHVIGWEGEVGAYGWGLRLGLLGWLRGQSRFESVESLMAQMRRDVARAEDLWAREFAREGALA